MRSMLGLARTCRAALLRSLLAALAFICYTQDSAVRAQASRVELDHVFVVVRPGAVAELAALRSAGFTVSPEPIKHVGQGTASVAAYLENGYLELIWLDSTVSTDPDHANTAQWFRAAAAWRTTGHSPFGVGLHRLPGDSGELPVTARLEAAPWLGPDQAYELLHTPADSLAADFFVVPPKAAVPSWIGRARQREPELWQHPNGSRAITLVRLHGRAEHEPQAGSMLRPDRIEFERASEPLLELHLDRGVPGGRLDLRPTLPLVLVQALETRIPVGTASLYARSVGSGQPLIVLHGGPDFDTGYLLPDLDRFSDAFRLIYYDQRGRGRSAEGVRPEDVTLVSEVADLDAVRQHHGLERAALLGHSWGTVLALEYALRHPDRVSHLVLMNPAPASASDLALFRTSYLAAIGTEMARQREIAASPAYQEGDPAAVTARYRIHFKPALRRTADYEKLMARMQAAFISQDREGILKARAVEDRLVLDTWQLPGYDLLPKLRDLRIPTLVITGEQDFIPVDVARNIAAAIPGARLARIPECGHFAYMECAGEVRAALNDFFRENR